MRFRFAAAALGLSLIASSAASAVSIGVNFTGGGNGSSPAISLLPADMAGVVPQGNFNNVNGGTNAALALVDSNNAATTATLTHSSGGTYSSIGGAGITPAGGDEKLNTGFIFGNASVTVNNIPYANYDLYVYHLNDAAGRVEATNIGGTVQADQSFLGGTTFYGASASPADAGHVDQNANTSYVYTQSVGGTKATATANGDYALFSNLSGSSVTFQGAATGNGYLNGFQIVQVPEPASLGLIGLVVGGLLVRRRRAAR